MCTASHRNCKGKWQMANMVGPKWPYICEANLAPQCLPFHIYNIYIVYVCGIQHQYTQYILHIFRDIFAQSCRGTIADAIINHRLRASDHYARHLMAEQSSNLVTFLKRASVRPTNWTGQQNRAPCQRRLQFYHFSGDMIMPIYSYLIFLYTLHSQYIVKIFLLFNAIPVLSFNVSMMTALRLGLSKTSTWRRRRAII